MDTRHYDAIVIGSGGGMKIALPAAQQGRRVALIDHSACGGTCLNRGCIPSKMLIWPMEQADRIRVAHKVNVAVDSEPVIDFSSLTARINETVDSMSKALRDRCEAQNNLDYYPFPAYFSADKTVRVGETMLTGDRIFIATGARPHIPNIPGLASVPFMTSTDALHRSDVPESLLVLGGGYIAAELGNAYRAAGSRVTFLVRSRMIRSEDREIADAFLRVFRQHHTLEEGFAALAVSGSADRIEIEGRDAAGQPCRRRAAALLVATGVVPNSDGLGLENTGVERTQNGMIKTDACLRTTASGVYALGDIAGRYGFRHTVNREGDYLLRTAFADAEPEPLDYGPVPHAIFSNPEIAGVGLTEEEARLTGTDIMVGRATYADSNQGLARQLTHGLCKILVDRATRRLIGAHIVGDDAATMIHMLILLMKTGGTLDDLLEMIFIHPALPEIVRDAARDAASQTPA